MNKDQPTFPLRFYPAILVIFSSLWLSACDNKPPLQSISMGAPQSTQASLIWLTDDLGFFEEQGIQLDLHAHPSGKRALAAMLRGEVKLAVTAETPFVIASFKRDDLRLYASMGQSDNELRILARRDHGINQPADLRGKTIATQQGSAVHFFLSSFLLYYQLDSTSTSTRFMKAEDLPAALTKGDIDAFSMREPYLSQAKKLIGIDKLVEFSVPGLYTKSYNLVGTADFDNNHPGVIRKILFALNKGANYADKNPDKALQIISRKLQLPQVTVASLLSDMRLSVTLNQGLLITLQEEAQWAVTTGLIKPDKQSDTQIPDFLTRINSTPLEEAIPYAVGLIGIKPR